MGNSACLGEKAIHVGACHLLMQDFYGRLSLKIDMLSEENVSEVPPTQQADKAIIPKLLSYTADHGPPPFGCPSSLYGFSISSGSSIIRETRISINLHAILASIAAFKVPGDLCHGQLRFLLRS
jgi:hypothetical protein